MKVRFPKRELTADDKKYGVTDEDHNMDIMSDNIDKIGQHLGFSNKYLRGY